MRRRQPMSRSVLVTFLMLSTSPVLSAARSPLWGRLEPGSHAVGFQQWDRYDHARLYRPLRGLDGAPRSGEHARPMRISLWYPALAGGGVPLSLGDYIAMLGGETRLGPLTADQARAGREAFFAFPLLRDLTAEQRTRLEAMPSAALRGAKPAAGRFPVVLYSLGSAALAHVTPEYLASHGYVVVQMPRLGAVAGLPDTGGDADDLDAKVRDMDFLINAVHEPSFGRRRCRGLQRRRALGTLGSHASAAGARDGVTRHGDALRRRQGPRLEDDAVLRSRRRARAGAAPDPKGMGGPGGCEGLGGNASRGSFVAALR